MSNDSENLYHTPAISRDGFAFNGQTFYPIIDWLDPHDYHPRMDSKELYALLTQTGRRTTRKASFYSAQMAHYGLRPTKTLNSALYKLQTAFSRGGEDLFVPKAISDLEVALKKEWHAADEVRERRLAKALQAKEDAKRDKEQKKLPLKTHSEDESKPQSSSALKRRKRSDPLRDQIEELSGPEARGVLLGILDSGRSGRETIATALSPRKRPRTVTGKGKEHKSDKIPLRPSNWVGKYRVLCEDITEEWPDFCKSDLKLEVYPSSTHAHLWASFDFGVISGVIRSIGKPPSFFGESIRFEWRGWESGEGTMVFSKYHCGIMRFQPGGIVEAEMQGDPCGKFSFTGASHPKVPIKNATQQKRDIRRWKRDWRSINSHNEEVTILERTRTWVPQRADDSPFESDTTAGDYERDEEPDFDGLDSGDEGY